LIGGRRDSSSYYCLTIYGLQNAQCKEEAYIFDHHQALIWLKDDTVLIRQKIDFNKALNCGDEL